MKKIMLISSMLFLGMMISNNANAQSVQEILQQQAAEDLKNFKSKECHDDEEYMAATGYATAASRHNAEMKAQRNAKQKLVENLEQDVDAVLEDMAHDMELDNGTQFESVSIREINSGFRSIIKKSLRHITTCASAAYKNEKGQWEAMYSGKVAIEPFIKEAESAFGKDVTMNALGGLEKFKTEFRKHLNENGSEE